MIMDKEALFFDEVTLPTAATLASSSYDLGAAGLRPGMGEMVRLFAQITGANAAGLTNALIQVVADTVATLASPTVLYATPVVVTATMVVGYRFNIPALPVDNIAEQFIGLTVVTTGPAPTGLARLSGGIITGDQNLQIGWPGVAAETGFNR